MSSIVWSPPPSISTRCSRKPSRNQRQHPAPRGAKRYVVWKLFNQAYREQKGRSLLKHDEPQGINEEVYEDTHGARPAGIEPAGMEPHDFREDRLSLLVRRAVEQDIISLSRGAEFLRLPLEQMRALSASWVA